MLSRVADRLYWMARYLERAEVTARLSKAYSHLILDIPRGSGVEWHTLIRIIDGEAAFSSRYRNNSERNILKFMIADMDNIGSIRFSVSSARENVRTTRDVLPQGLWELINEFHLYVDEWAEKSLARRNRFEFLDTVIAKNQQINGLIESAVTRDHAYSFLKMGRLLERSDMTSRTVDAATDAILKHGGDEMPQITLIWTSLLKAVSASSAYRREVGPLVEGREVVNFLCKSQSFPRAILFCMLGIEQVLQHLKNREQVAEQLSAIVDMIAAYDTESGSLADLHAFIDRLQERFNSLDNAIAHTWFALPQP